MRKLSAIAIGIMVILSLTLPIPVMAAGNPNPGKPDASPPHYDINFLTGLTAQYLDPTLQYQVKVFGNTTIPSVVDFYWGDDFRIIDNDATDGDPALVQLPGDLYYEIFVQIRGKPTTGSTWGGTYYRSATKPVWIPFEDAYVPTGYFVSTEYWYEGCSNFCTRWVYSTP